MGPADDARRDLGKLAHVEFGPAPAGTAGLAAWFEGEEPATTRFRKTLERVVREPANLVLLLGEPGSGRHRAASWIHRTSRRNRTPLAVVDAASPGAAEELREITARLAAAGASAPEGDPTLPGHVLLRDAHLAGPNLAEAAVEILSAQGVALRCGVIATAAAPPDAPQRRDDAATRLAARPGATTVHVPPLRARSGDIPVLARTLLRKWATRLRRDVHGLSPQAEETLRRHPFPGNVQELSCLLYLSILHTRSTWITVDALAPLAGASATSSEPGELVFRLPGASLRDVELETLRMALRLTGGRVVRAAEMLGITRHALRRKLEKYNLGSLRHRPPPSPAESTPNDDDNYI